MAYTGPQYTMSPTPDKRSSPAFPGWDDFVASLQLDPSRYGHLQTQAQNAAKLASSPALRALQRREAAANRQYQFSKAELEPAMQRFIAEQQYNLGQTLAANELSRSSSMQDYDISARALAESLAEQRRRTEMDMARRGLWQSGLLSKAYGGLQGKYLTSLGDLERSRYNRLQDIQRTGDLARQKALFELSDAQRAKASELAKLLSALTGEQADIGYQRQQVGEEQGMRQSELYNQLLQQLFSNAMAARQQGLAESQFHHDAWWAQANADEDRRRFELNYALQKAAAGR